MITFGIKHLDFSQTDLSTTWEINHNFGVEPAIEVMAYDSNGILQKAFPLSVSHTNENQTIITWTSSKTGHVILAAKQI